MIWGLSIRKRRGAALHMPRRRSRGAVRRSGQCGFRRIRTEKWFIREYQHGTGCGDRQVQNKGMEEKKTELLLELIDDEMNFGEALAHLKEGGKATREKWRSAARKTEGDVEWIRLVELEETSDFDYGMENKPYLELKTSDDKLIPWVATQDDLLAEDWILLKELPDALA